MSLLSLSFELFFPIVRFFPPPPLDDDDLRPPDDDEGTVLCGVVEGAITPSRNRGGGVRDRLDDSRGIAVAALAEAAAASTADKDDDDGGGLRRVVVIDDDVVEAVLSPNQSF